MTLDYKCLRNEILRVLTGPCSAGCDKLRTKTHTSDANTSSDGGGRGRSGCSVALPKALRFFKRVWSKQSVVKPGKHANRENSRIFAHFYTMKVNYLTHSFFSFPRTQLNPSRSSQALSAHTSRMYEHIAPTAPRFQDIAYTAGRNCYVLLKYVKRNSQPGCRWAGI